MDTSLIKRLRQLMFGKISPGEFRQLRSDVHSGSDNDLQPLMKTLWEDPRTPVPVPADGNLRIIETLRRRTHKKPYRLSRLKVASVILLSLFFSWETYLFFARGETPAPDMVVMADSGQKTHLVLPDGSEVWLNSLSALRYPSDFGVKNRTVRLTGEGYFEVTADKTKTFRVETEGVAIVVRGTKFNVAAHAGAPETNVSLIEGSVAVEDGAHHLLAMLTGAQTLRINRKNLQFKFIEEDARYAALWSKNKCRVEDASAEEMAKKIGYWYGLNIRLENNNKDYRYGFTIKEESFREFLELIRELTPLEYSINGEEVVIRYK
ncbi:MAG: FecR family protein [Tannerellaceae bacterium]|jgi:ferric-dicitrate binding protein FerR (iron transport regulator)|nr:FecR family protein [Tannerellaceae bacterium]